MLNLEAFYAAFTLSMVRNRGNVTEGFNAFMQQVTVNNKY
jgi:hypothetical protein